VDVQARPELLAEHVPAEWIGKRELAGVLTAALVLQGGCGPNGAERGRGGGTTAGVERTGVVQTRPGNAAPKRPVVAPLFEHGEGRGVSGCIVVAPPVFLSEEEALQIIREELNLAGVDMPVVNVPLEGVKPPGWRARFLGHRTDDPVMDGMDGKVRIDLENLQRHVGVEFVSADDCLEMEEKEEFSSVTEYDCKGTAQRLARSVRKSKEGLYFATFYDPTAVLSSDDVRSAMAMHPNQDELRAAMQKLREKAKVEPKRLLREQVRDFVTWLKGQGVI
jgi:hypothetical protein